MAFIRRVKSGTNAPLLTPLRDVHAQSATDPSAILRRRAGRRRQRGGRRGTLLTFPALLCAGQLARVANATSTVALWRGRSSFWGYRSEMGSSRREIAMLFIPSFLGGIAGAVLLVSTSNESFARVVPFLILLATTLFIVQEPLGRWLRRRAAEGAADGLPQQGDVVYGTRDEMAQVRSTGFNRESAATPPKGGTTNGAFSAACSTTPPFKPSRARWASVLAHQFAVGVYGGYFGAGIGILMLAAFGLLGLTNIHHMNALKNLNGMCINGIAAVAVRGQGRTGPLGHRPVDGRRRDLRRLRGAGTARRIGQKNVRRMIILIGIALTLWLLAQQWHAAGVPM